MIPYKNSNPILNPKATLWISANAGSGKTQQLINRVLALLLQGIPHTQILCLTYTKAAAAEMLDRIYDRLIWLTTASSQDVQIFLEDFLGSYMQKNMVEYARTLLISILEHPQPLRIQTIHAFCEYMLSLFPMEAGLIPGFGLLDDKQSAAYIQRIMPAFFALCEKDPELSENFNYILQFSSNFDKFYQFWLNILHTNAPANSQPISPKISVSNLQNLKFNGFLTENRLQALKTLCQSLDESKHPVLFQLANASDIPHAEPYAKDYIFTYLLLLNDKRGLRKIKSKNRALTQFLQDEQQSILIYMQQEDQKKLATWSFMMDRLRLVWIGLYQSEKHSTNDLDFHDLLVKTYNLLSTVDNEWINYKLDTTIHHILVDEAQDMSTLQWDLVMSLCSDFFTTIHIPPKSLFVVGDIKQSIYGFQGAKPDIFQQQKQAIQQSIKPLEQETKEKIFYAIPLDVSYRMPDELTTFVDKALERVPFFKDTMPLKANHQPKKSGGKIILLPPFYGKISKSGRELGEYLAKMLNKTLYRLYIPAKQRKLQPEDVYILLQRRSSNIDTILLTCLEKAGIPVQISRDMDYKTHLAVLDILSLARFILTPFDDLNFAQLLKSCFLSLNDYDLLLLKTHIQKDSLKKHSLYEEFEKFAQQYPSYQPLLIWLKNLQTIATETPFNFFSKILQRSCPKAHSLYAQLIHTFGIDTSQVLNQLLRDSYDFNNHQTGSLLTFIDEFIKSPTNIPMPSKTQSVTITTVHGVKGKEAPFIIVADALRKPKTTDSSTFIPLDPYPYFSSGSLVPFYRSDLVKENYFPGVIQQEILEYYRLMYVAFSRSSDVLIIAGTKTKKDKNTTSVAATSVAAPSVAATSVKSSSIESTLKKIDVASNKKNPIEHASQPDDAILIASSKHITNNTLQNLLNSPTWYDIAVSILQKDTLSYPSYPRHTGKLYQHKQETSPSFNLQKNHQIVHKPATHMTDLPQWLYAHEKSNAYNKQNITAIDDASFDGADSAISLSQKNKELSSEELSSENHTSLMPASLILKTNHALQNKKNIIQGIIIHELAQFFGYWQKEKQEQYTMEYLNRFHISRPKASHIYKILYALWYESPLSSLLQHSNILSEKSFYDIVTNHPRDLKKEMPTLRLDKVFLGDSINYFIDFKTLSSKKIVSNPPKTYIQQMNHYQDRLQQFSLPVKGYLVYIPINNNASYQIFVTHNHQLIPLQAEDYPHV